MDPEREAEPIGTDDPLHDVFQTTIDQAIWSRIHEHQRVVDVDGAPLGHVREKLEHMCVVEAPRTVATTQELYIPHFVFDRVDDNDTAHIAWSRSKLDSMYQHYCRYHFVQPPERAGS